MPILVCAEKRLVFHHAVLPHGLVEKKSYIIVHFDEISMEWERHHANKCTLIFGNLT